MGIAATLLISPVRSHSERMGIKSALSFGRAVGLLQAIVRDDAVRPAPAVAAALDFPDSSARRIVAALAEAGLIERVGPG